MRRDDRNVPADQRNYEQWQLRELGWRAAHHRVARELDARSVAADAGLAEPELQAIERGEDPSLTYLTVVRLCRALDIALADLFTATSAEPPTVHELPVSAETFQLIADGTQQFVLARNGPNYRPGDRLHLVDTADGRPTGRDQTVDITYIAYGDSVGVAPGCVVMAVQPAALAWVVTRTRARSG